MAPFEDLERYNPTNRIKGLSEQASSVRVDANIPAKRYFRSSLEMTRMAKVFYSENNLESAFVLYQKYLCLLLERLPKHPEYNSAELSSLRKTTTKLCKEAISSAEEIKAKLKTNYEAEYKERQLAEALRLQKLKEEAERRAEEERRHNEEEAARLADEQEAKRKQALEDEDRKYAMYLQQEMSKETHMTEPSAPPYTPAQPSAPSQPAALAVSAEVPRPNVPTNAVRVLPAVGSLPINPPSYGEAISEQSASKPTPSVDRTTKPTAHFTHTDSDLSLSNNKYGLKTVTVPITIPQKFTQLANENTVRNMETCGLLFGKLEQGAFHITHVVIPKQKGAPDSCTMLNEEEIFQFHDEHELIQLGWIHTHPTQTAFLSSVDLHTHVGYQIMMPESIAIVVSPKFNELGIFQLTPEHGLDYISTCTLPGFHPHPKEPPLFQKCEHVSMDQSRLPVFVDLR